MATVTKTYTENINGSYKATWTITLTANSDMTVSGSTFTVPVFAPVVKYVYSGKNMAEATVNYHVYINGTKLNYYQGYGTAVYDSMLISLASGTSKTLVRDVYAESIPTQSTSTYFNTSNKTSRTVSLQYRIADMYLWSCKGNIDTQGNGITVSSGFDIFSPAFTITLNAPPIISATKTSTTNSKGYYWKNISSALVTISNSWAQYGGDIASATLTIGEQTATATTTTWGKLSICPNTAGTFTPVLTVTDTRGQTTTKNLEEITVQEFQATTATWGTIQSDTNGYYANVSTASLTVSDITVMEGFSVTSVKLTIGNQSQSVTTLTNDSASFSIPLNAVGTFTPNVKIYTSADVYTTYNYSPITVGEYIQPNVSFQTYRAKNEPETNPTKFGIKDEEGEEVLIEATFNYLSDICELVEPTVTVTDENGDTYSAVTTWYTTYSETNGVSSAVNWTNYNPTSPVTLYGLATGYGSTTGFSDGDAFQITITPEDSFGQGNSITNAVSSSYFTIDFQAGGKEICFGGPANDANVSTNHPKGLFKCKMDTEFNDMTSTEVDNFISDLDISGSGIDLTQADWIVEQGTDGDWTWRKWNSGVAECWGVFLHNTTVASAWGTGFLSNAKTITFPSDFFISMPVGLSLYADSTWVGMATCENTVTTKDSLKCYIFRTSSTGTSVADFYIHVEAKGRWK